MYIKKKVGGSMSMLDEKRIETLTMKVKDIKTGFGNPRKIGKKEAEELAGKVW